MRERLCGLLLFWFACATIALPAPVRGSPRPSATPERTISMVVNGETVRTETPPRIVGGRVFVPLRPVFDAVGLEIARAGGRITSTLPAGPMQLEVGSTQAVINGRTVALDGTVIDMLGTAYVPLRFLSQSLGAVAVYDQAQARVEIVSGLVGRNVGPEQQGVHGGTTVIGSVSAVDANSSPPSITVVQSGIARTIAITSRASIFIEDTSIRSQVKGTLGDVRVGDALRAVLRSDGSVVEVHAFFRSQTGTIAALSASAFVLQSGRVVSPERDTAITLNGATATVADLKVGDEATVRSNPETGRLRQIIVSRSGSASAQPAGAVAIAGFNASLKRPLRAGESFDAVMQGTPGGQASFDIGDLVTGIVMHEGPSGTYTATFKVPDRFNVDEVPLYGHLVAGGQTAARVTAPSRLSTGTVPPQIAQVAPLPGQTVNNHRPNIYATFFVPSDIGVDPATVVVSVQGRDVTAGTTKTGNFVTYAPGSDLPSGEVRVSVRVSDTAGNVGSRSWSFFIR